MTGRNDPDKNASVELTCTRCNEPRWAPTWAVPTKHDYICQRCRAVKAGRPAADPLGKKPTAAQLAAREQFTQRRRTQNPLGKQTT